ncbi:HAD family hydrolase [Marinivivus vitaminiproducens]|uniref:HAD family hydrolase n=1 Tax=Marinivivus vitaminiproducens TaxID=3035935 RepID=UPI00279CE549|nr:HAD hydrolase-like protein [Geminicoccaceae bacterium SCSIO 64248]
MLRRPQAVVFDVIETLFPLEPLDEGLQALGLPANAVHAWFAGSLRDFFALGAVGQFQPLRVVMESNLDDLLARAGKTAGDEAKADLLGRMAALEPHPETKPAIDILKAAGVGTTALTNGSAEATEGLFARIGLGEVVTPVITVGEIRLPKPRAEVYRHAATRIGIAPERLILVACHPWDLNGARAIGMRTGFVARGRPYPRFLADPDLVAEDLTDLARAIADLPA